MMQMMKIEEESEVGEEVAKEKMKDSTIYDDSVESVIVPGEPWARVYCTQLSDEDEGNSVGKEIQVYLVHSRVC